LHDSPDAVAEAFVAAINAGDIDAALELWLDDAVLLGPRDAALRGRDAIRGVLTTLIENGTKLAFESVTSYAAGPAAVRTGKLRMSAHRVNGAGFDGVATFLTVYAHAHGGWLIAIDGVHGFAPD
jgi:ketosteroid isomerase-like protein